MGQSEEQRIKEWYNNLTSSYEELYGQEQATKHRAVIEFIRNQRFKLFVDVGCGSGVLLQAAEPLYEHAVGVDLSIGMLKAVKRKGLKKTDLVLASSRMLPIKPDTVDCLVSISALKADSTLQPFLREMKIICRSPGLQVVSLFEQRGEEKEGLIAGSASSSKISERETVYFLRSNGQQKATIVARHFG